MADPFETGKSSIFFPLLAILCLLTVGCGGEETPPPKVTAKSKPAETASPEKEEADDTKAENESDESKSAESGDDSETTETSETGDSETEGESKPKAGEKEAALPAPPKRPKELEKWKKDDYLSAKREGDRNLEAAVNLMGERFQGDPRAAGLFKELLLIEHVPAVKKPDGTAGKPLKIAAQTTVVDALVKALVKNKTPESTAILKELLFNKLETPLPARRGLTLILTEMVAQLEYAEYEDLIFEFLTNPQKALAGEVLVPDESYSNSRLQGDLVGMLNSVSTPSINLRLAKHLDDPTVSKDLATQIEGLLIRDRPETLSARLLLYQNEHSESRTKTAAEAALILHSGTALSILLGLPPKLEDFPAPGTVSRPTARQRGYSEEEVSAELSFASGLWSPEFDAFLMQQIAKKDKLEESPGPLQLIGSMPTPFARFSMSELFAIHGASGPRGWTSAGLMGRSNSDPAIVVLAKALYHGPARRTTRVDPNDKRPAPDQAARDSWRDAMDPLIQSWIKRFYSAARNSTPETWTAAKETGNFAVVPHKDANIVAEYHLLWPGETQTQIPSVVLAPLEVHYVRIEEEAVPEKLSNHYKRYGASGATAPKRTVRNGFWFDDLTIGATPRSKRSIDVIISHKPIAEVKPTPGVVQEQKPVTVVIDILTIEIPEIVAPTAAK